MKKCNSWKPCSQIGSRITATRVEKRLDERCDEHFHYFSNRCDTINQHVDVIALRDEERIIALEMMKTEMDIWKPEIEKVVEGLSVAMEKVGKFLKRDHRSSAFDKPGIFDPYESVPARSPAGFHRTDGPYGCRIDTHHWECESGHRGA